MHLYARLVAMVQRASRCLHELRRVDVPFLEQMNTGCGLAHLSRHSCVIQRPLSKTYLWLCYYVQDDAVTSVKIDNTCA